MKIRVSKSLFRVLAFTTVIIALSSCGSNSNNSSGNPNTTATTGTGTTGGTGTPNTGINLYTSICDPTVSASNCPANEVPFQAKVELDEQLPNGWLPVATVTTGSIGNVILEVPAGNYRLLPASSGNGSATASPVLVTVTSGQLSVASVNFSGTVPN